MTTTRMTTTGRAVFAVARELADDLLFPDASRVDRLDVLPAAHLDALAAAGLYGAPVPVQADGLGLDLADYCAVVEALASGCLATTFVWLQHRGVVMTLAADSTPAALRDRWLGPACQGEVRGGIALGGLIPGPPPLRAVPDGDGWRLDGQAPWVTGWGLIDLLLVVARGPGDSLLSLILDAAAQPGLTVTRERLAAVNASVTVRLGFDGVSVPAERQARQEPFDPAESLQRVLELALLEVNAREPIGGVVTHLLIDRAFEHRGDRVPRAVVHSVVELEVADREFGVAQVIVERVELRLVERAMLGELGVEPLERVEEMALSRVVQRFAEVEVVQRLVVRPPACRSGQRRSGDAQHAYA